MQRKAKRRRWASPLQRAEEVSGAYKSGHRCEGVEASLHREQRAGQGSGESGWRKRAAFGRQDGEIKSRRVLLIRAQRVGG